MGSTQRCPPSITPISGRGDYTQASGQNQSRVQETHQGWLSQAPPWSPPLSPLP
jgi:hypothetical protein